MIQEIIQFINSSENSRALGDSEAEISKNDLSNHIQSFSIAFKKKLNPNSNKQPSVAILLDRRNAYFTSMFAAWHIDAYFIPLNIKWPEARVNSVLDHAKPDIVICHKDGWYHEENAIYVEDIHIDAHPPLLNKTNASDEQLAYIIYTSGSTGTPKGVCISVKSYRSYVNWTNSYFSNYKTNKALLITAELTFDITMGDIAFALAFGTSICVSPDPKNVFSHIKLIQKYSIDTFYSVPTTHQLLFSFIERKKSLDISTINLVLSGGESFSPELPKLIKQLLPNAHFYNVYGPTEVTINCFASRLDNKLEELDRYGVPIGRVFDHLSAILLDNDDNPITDPSSKGHLCVSGAQCMDGYLNDDELSANSFVNIEGTSYYKTGDLVIVKPETGLTYILGRIDDLVKIKGYRVNPNEINRSILKHSSVKAAQTILVDEENPYFLSFVQGDKEEKETIQSQLEKELPAYMVPKDIQFIANFPLNSSGKIDKKQLLEAIKS